MKIEFKRDDVSLKDVIVELKPGFYYSESQWGRGTEISVSALVEFYEKWSKVVFNMTSMTSMKQIVNSIYGNLVELDKMIGETIE